MSEFSLSVELAKYKERCEQLEKQIRWLQAELDRERMSRLTVYGPIPTSTTGKGCHVCGIGSNGEIMGYVCPRTDCPSRVTC